MKLQNLLRIALEIINELVAISQNQVYLECWKGSPILWDYEDGMQNSHKKIPSKARKLLKLYESFVGQKENDRIRFKVKTEAIYFLDIRKRHSKKKLGFIALQRANNEEFSQSEVLALKAVGRLLSDELLGIPESDGRLKMLHLHMLDQKIELADSENVEDLLDSYLRKIAIVCHREWPVEKPTIVRMTAKIASPVGTALFVKGYLDNKRDYQHLPKKLRKMRYDLRSLDSIAARVHKREKALFVKNYRERVSDKYRVFQDVQTHISAPIVAGKSTCAGVFSIESSSRSLYSAAHVDLATLVAAHAARPVTNALKIMSLNKQNLDRTEIENTILEIQLARTWNSARTKLVRCLRNLGYGRGMLSKVSRDPIRVDGLLSWGKSMKRLCENTSRTITNDRSDCQIKAVVSKSRVVVDKPKGSGAVHPDALELASLGPFAIIPLIDTAGEVEFTLHLERGERSPLSDIDFFNIETVCRAAMSARARIEREASLLRRGKLDDLALRWSDSLQSQFPNKATLLTNLARFCSNSVVTTKSVALLNTGSGWRKIAVAENGRSKEFSPFEFLHVPGGTFDLLKKSNDAIIVRANESVNDQLRFDNGVALIHPSFNELNLLGLEMVDAWVELPVRVGGRLFGVVLAHSESDFDTGERKYFCSLAKSACLAAERIDLQQQLEHEAMLAASMAVFRHEVANSFRGLSKIADIIEAKGEIGRVKHFIHKQQEQIEKLKDFFSSGVVEMPESVYNERSISDEIQTAIELLGLGDNLVDVQVDNNSGMVPSNRHPLCLILLQLLQNAHRALEGVGGGIRMYCTKNAHHNILVVEDGGVGMSPEDFKRFRSKTFAWPSRSSVHTHLPGRMGIGLLYARVIARSLGWVLEPTSRKKPTRWEIKIPCINKFV